MPQVHERYSKVSAEVRWTKPGNWTVSNLNLIEPESSWVFLLSYSIICPYQFFGYSLEIPFLNKSSLISELTNGTVLPVWNLLSIIPT